MKDEMELPIKSERLNITEFDSCMAESVHKLSLDEDNCRFVPDEVFETVDEARKILEKIIKWYSEDNAPLIYAVTLDGIHIGHVQIVPFGKEWEIGYHIGKEYTGKGYATEVVRLFLPDIMKYLDITKIYGLCHADNIASCRVLEKNGFVLEFSGMGKYQNKIANICRYVKINNNI